MKTFLFDIGNVLVDFDFNHLYEIHARYTGKAAAPFSDADWVQRDAVERGLISDAEWVGYLNQSKGLGWTEAMLVEAWREMFTRNETGYGLFRQAIGSDAHVYTLSNIAKHHMDAIEANWNGFFDGATGLFLSYQMGVRKPDPAIYRHAIDALGVAPQDCFFIDDLPENIAAARALGIHAHRFVPENYDSIVRMAHDFFGWDLAPV